MCQIGGRDEKSILTVKLKSTRHVPEACLTSILSKKVLNVMTCYSTVLSLLPKLPASVLFPLFNKVLSLQYIYAYLKSRVQTRRLLSTDEQCILGKLHNNSYASQYFTVDYPHMSSGILEGSTTHFSILQFNFNLLKCVSELPVKKVYSRKRKCGYKENFRVVRIY